MHAVPGRAGVDSVERGDELDLRGRQPDLLLGLAERRRQERGIALLRLAAREADCPFVAFRPRPGDLETNGVRPAAVIADLRELLALELGRPG